MEYILTDIRKGHMCNAKLLRNMPGKARGPAASVLPHHRSFGAALKDLTLGPWVGALGLDFIRE